MKVLITIPHYYFAESGATGGGSGSTDYSSTNSFRRDERKAAIRKVIGTWHEDFGGYRAGFDPGARRNEIIALPNYEIKIIVLTVGDRHLIDTEFASGHSVDVIDTKRQNPRLLGFSSPQIFEEHRNNYDVFIYSEDDLLPIDQHFLDKILWFSEKFGPNRILMPNRFEINTDNAISKVYIDAEFEPVLAHKVKNIVQDVECLSGCVLGRELDFGRAGNPHSGMHILTRDQLLQWRRQNYWLKEETSFIGPLESAATLGVLKTFSIFKSARQSMDFSSVQHLDNRWSSMFIGRPWGDTKNSRTRVPSGLITSAVNETYDPSRHMHIHLAAMSPQFMDVRTSLPLSALAKSLNVKTSISRQQISLPPLPSNQPKVLIIQRIAVADVASYKAAVKRIVEQGWIIIAEFDDHPDLINAVHGRPPSDAMWHSIRLAHAVQTSTPILAESFRVCNSKVAFFPNAAFRFSAGPRELQPGGVIRIFYGALNRERFSSRIGAALADLAVRRPNLQFVVVHDRAFFEALGPANKLFHPALPYDQYLSTMESCHIALMPLQGGPGEIYKSDVKFVEASSLGLATLASPTVYGATILDGVTGVIVPDVDGWAGALEAIVSNQEQLKRIAGAAFTYAKEQRQFAAQVEHRLAWYWHLWEERLTLTRSLSKRFQSV